MWMAVKRGKTIDFDESLEALLKRTPFSRFLFERGQFVHTPTEALMNDALLASAFRKVLSWTGWIDDDFSTFDVSDCGSPSQFLLSQEEIEACRIAQKVMFKQWEQAKTEREER